MAIVLSDYEAAPKHKGDYADELARLQKRLAHIQIAHIVHKRRAIVVFEGWDAAGKGGTIQRLTAAWDARHVAVHAIVAPTAEEKARHHLARFWSRLPMSGQIAVFDRSWYGRVLAERVEGLTDRAGWRRAYDEINEFEAQQKDSGTTLVKLFLHISETEQARRFRARIEHPWKRWKLTVEDLRNGARRADHVAAAEEMFARTDTRWAPWKAIDADHKKQARLAALAHVADVLEKAVPMTPPAPDAAVAQWAREAWGIELA